MKLYEISGMFAELFDRFDDIANYTPDTDEYGRYITEEGDIIEDLDAYRNAYLTAWFDSLTALEGEFNEKAENVAVYIKNLTADINEMKAEEKRLKSRRVSAENQVERMKKYLINSMQAIGVKKISMPRARITLRLNAESVAVENEKALIDWAMRHDETILKYQEPELKKTDIKELLRMGEKIPFARLERKESVMLK
jgi:hypothetical protein